MLALAFAFAQQQVKTKYGSSTTKAQGYLQHMVMFRQIKTLDPDYLEPKQFFKLAQYSSDFPCARVCRISFSPVVTVGLGFEFEHFFTALCLNLNE